ncbi:MAG TPA: type II toxin-antitoxin system HicA family toxin [Thermoflexia bacterium]|jgi:predicted RNA binding protein YcfA (HicA-like mRNA interferase family)|nr:MAG: addiction module toxin, HicA family [Chloroflexota bacterium]HEY67431.1 type II toxin-antitoxin system HicA family toxin [Thermoflexia bacterium]
MKRRALLKHLKRHGCELLREGSRHSIYWNPANRRTTSVPRHREIVDKLAIKICKDLDIPKP